MLIDEQLQPELFQIIDEVFEFDLPLVETETDFKSDVRFQIEKMGTFFSHRISF